MHCTPSTSVYWFQFIRWALCITLGISTTSRGITAMGQILDFSPSLCRQLSYRLHLQQVLPVEELSEGF